MLRFTGYCSSKSLFFEFLSQQKVLVYSNVQREKNSRAHFMWKYQMLLLYQFWHWSLLSIFVWLSPQGGPMFFEFI